MTLKFLKDVGHVMAGPFVGLGTSAVHLGQSVEKDIVKGAGTVHDDIKGITKGAYSLGKDITGGLNQLTSPITIIAIAVVVVVVLARK